MLKKHLLIMFSIVILFFSGSSLSVLSKSNESLPYKYEGETNADGLYEGVGTLFYKDKILYEGEFHANQFNGEGILYNVSANDDADTSNEYLLTNHKKYEGTFLSGQYHGKGTLYYETAINTSNTNKGIKYQGKFAYGQYHGYGIEYTMEGDIHREGYFFNGHLHEYQGSFDENGKMHGQGKLVNENKEVMFEGTFEHGEIHGYGVSYNINRTMRYEGNFVHDSLQGNGKIYVNDKLYYEGSFKDGLLDGDGTLYLPTEKVAYKGLFTLNRTKEQPFQVKAELTLNADMSATYSLYIVLLEDYLTDDTLAYLNSLEEMAAPHFDTIEKNDKKKEYISLKATKEIEDIEEIYYDEFFGFNFIINKTKLMIYEEYEAYAYLSVLNDPNLMNVSYEINLPDGAKNIHADGMARELVANKTYGWLDINDTDYKVVEFERKNSQNLFISVAFFIVLFIGIQYFRKQKKPTKKDKDKKNKKVDTTISVDTVNKQSVDESNTKENELTNNMNSDD